MNIGDIYAQTLAASSSAADLILVTPDKYTGFTKSEYDRNIVGFVFNTIGDEVVNLQSDITDHYVEDNTSRQDHIALRPITITVSGFIGELNNVVPDDLLPVKEALDRLSAIDSYVPSVTITARKAYNVAAQIYALSAKIQDAGKIKKKKKIQSKQEQAFNELYTFWATRRLFYVSTPYGQFANMAIQNIQAVQNAETKTISDFTVTFKEIKYASTQLKAKTTEADPRVSFDTPINMGSV